MVNPLQRTCSTRRLRRKEATNRGGGGTFTMKLSAFTCAVGAAMAAPLTSTLTMQSQLGSKLKMGGAVINGRWWWPDS